MKLINILQLLSLFLTINALADQGNGKTTKVTATTVYVTVTTKGVVTVVPSLYSQTFMTTFSSPTADVASGNIGLGNSATGSVGGVRSYDKTTITQPNLANMNNGFGLIIGFISILSWLL